MSVRCAAPNRPCPTGQRVGATGAHVGSAHPRRLPRPARASTHPVNGMSPVQFFRGREPDRPDRLCYWERNRKLCIVHIAHLCMMHSAHICVIHIAQHAQLPGASKASTSLTEPKAPRDKWLPRMPPSLRPSRCAHYLTPETVPCPLLHEGPNLFGTPPNTKALPCSLLA